MELQKKVWLIRCDSNESEEADIESLNHKRLVANSDIDQKWWEDLSRYGLIGDPSKEPDRGWDWREICSQSYGPAVYCIRTKDKRIQAVTSFFKEYKSFLEPGEKAFYIDRLATAPWNRGWLVQDPQYNRCGLSLIRYVVVQSHLHGLKGRVNLTAVAHVDFYLHLGFVETQERNGDGKIYELSTDAALHLMEDRRGSA
jgi:hypothetical protein